MLLGGFGQVTAARFGELAMAAILNLAGFEWTAAGLHRLMMAMMPCKLAVAVAAVLSLAVLERVAAIGRQDPKLVAAQVRDQQAELVC